MSFKNAYKRRLKGQAAVEYFILAAGIVAIVALTNNSLLNSMVTAGQDLVDRAADKMNSGGSSSSSGGDSGGDTDPDPNPDPGYPMPQMN